MKFAPPARNPSSHAGRDPVSFLQKSEIFQKKSRHSIQWITFRFYNCNWSIYIELRLLHNFFRISPVYSRSWTSASDRQGQRLRMLFPGQSSMCYNLLRQKVIKNTAFRQVMTWFICHFICIFRCTTNKNDH
jgi:hypothetical protein